MASVIKYLIKRWRGYKYRFLPWIAFNLKNRSVRAVPHASLDKLLPDAVVEKSLLTICSALENSKQANPDAATPFAQEIQLEQHNSKLCEGCESIRTHDAVQRGVEYGGGGVDNLARTFKSHCGCVLPLDVNTARTSMDVMYQVFGFSIDRRESLISGGGTGVIVTRGTIPKGSVLAMYPGTVYSPHEPTLIQSIGNRFIFRCLDGILIDGNDRGISKSIYKSCSLRERIGPYMTSDMTWLTSEPLNPLAIGQYINNHTKDIPANVDYQEFDVPLHFPLNLRKYLPNVFYSTEHEHGGDDYLNRRLLRTVVLVSVRQIEEGEELLSSYFTVVH